MRFLWRHALTSAKKLRLRPTAYFKSMPIRPLRYTSRPYALRLWPNFSTVDEVIGSTQTPFFLTFTSETMPAGLYYSASTNFVTLSQYKKSYVRGVLGAVPPRYRASELRSRVVPSLELTTPLVLAAAGVPSAFRYASIARYITTQALRRALLLVATFPLCLVIKGVFTNFPSFWARLNGAGGEVFSHPLSGAPIFDIAVKRLNGGVSSAAALQSAVYLTDFTAESLPLAERKALDLFFQNKAASGATRALSRYHFEWVTCEVSLKTPHGYIRTPRRRSIKKRLAKRLTKLAQRRFWVL